MCHSIFTLPLVFTTIAKQNLQVEGQATPTARSDTARNTGVTYLEHSKDTWPTADVTQTLHQWCREGEGGGGGQAAPDNAHKGGDAHWDQNC